MADKYLTGKGRREVIPYSAPGPTLKGTGTPPESAVRRELALDPFGSKLPIGGMSKEDLERILETEKTTASDDLAKFKKDVEATQVAPSGAAPVTTKQSASELLRQYKQQIAEQQVAVPPIPEPGRELQYELRPVEKPMTSQRRVDKGFEERREAQQSIQDLEKVLASLQKNRKGNYKPVTIRESYGEGAEGKIVAYRGFILNKDWMGDDTLAWTAHDPQSAEDDPQSAEDVDLGYPTTIEDAQKNIDELWDDEAVSGGKLWGQKFYDWGLIPSIEAVLPERGGAIDRERQRGLARSREEAEREDEEHRAAGRYTTKEIVEHKRAEHLAEREAESKTIQEGADEFEKIHEAPLVVEEVSAKLLPEETFETSAIGKGRQSLFDPELKEGRRLLIMSCCITKTDDPGKIPALERYAGTLFQTLKGQGIPDDVDVAILSAKHGLIRINHPLSKYDTQMTKATQKKLLEDDKFTQLVQGTLEGYDDILVAGGKLYREPIRELSRRRDWFRGSTGTTEGTELPVPPGTITETIGSQGVQRQELKKWLRKSYGNDTLDEMIDDLRRPGKSPTKREIHGPSLHEFARLKGIKEFSVQALGLEGDLKRLELESDRKPGQRLTVREDGMDLDDLVRAAQEAGYFGTTSDWEIGPDINQLLELLGQSKMSPVYSEFEGDPDKVGWDEAVSDLDQQLTESGIDLDQPNKVIREQLEQWQFRDIDQEEEIPFETEATPEGIQTLIEGVEPVTTQDLLEVEAERPLRGGEAEAGPLFDVEGRAQMDLVEESRKTETEEPTYGDVAYNLLQLEKEHGPLEELRNLEITRSEATAEERERVESRGLTQIEKRNKVTEGFDALVSRSLRASRRGVFPEVNVPVDRLPEDSLGTGSLMFYRGFPIERIKEWNNDKQKMVEMHVVLSPEAHDLEIQAQELQGSGIHKPGVSSGTLLAKYSTFQGPTVKHKHEAVKFVNDLWDKNPEAWNKVMRSLGYKYAERHVFDRIKKAAGGFIDKPLYERTL